jgi:hypothetical protein
MLYALKHKPMRNLIIKKSKRSSFPWGPASSVNGEQYLAAATAFNGEGQAFGDTFSVRQMLAKGEELAPEWFEKHELAGGDVAQRLNLAGALAQMGNNKFFLQWFPKQRVWQVLDAGDKYDRTDAAETLGHAAGNIRDAVIRVYQMATHLIEELDPEEQEAHVAEFQRVMSELDIIEDWGKHKMRTLLEAASRAHPQLGGNGLGQLTDGKKK